MKCVVKRIHELFLTNEYFNAILFVGITSKTIKLESSATEKDILNLINKLNKDDTVDGILVQLPVPEHVSERTVCNAVDPRKDIDGFHINNMGKLCVNNETFVPCTALGVMELIKRNELPGLEATVTLCHRNTPREELVYFAKRADIIISATGVVNLITPDMVKPGACIIDVGITRIQTEDGKTKLVGDVDFDGVSKVAGHITPVPGGVGPMTVAMLMKNTFQAAKSLKGTT
ncbi:hypothetical protein HHI36_015731 [Cryptolaemus montrouzieri]|uniref:methenyltetrahydrofolate cyclohydrolase n=1 Tax=Cryptolaemus montrouzieri TaxID=559131 RepID=A0ABD2N7X8_9CUCU